MGEKMYEWLNETTFEFVSKISTHLCSLKYKYKQAI